MSDTKAPAPTSQQAQASSGASGPTKMMVKDSTETLGGQRSGRRMDVTNSTAKVPDKPQSEQSGRGGYEKAIPDKYSKGGEVKKTGMALVHKGERVLTKRQAKRRSGRSSGRR